jgi:NAD(P)-dependent dehydrogenase (short-subunit alcohol dehydrogenase family)
MNVLVVGGSGGIGAAVVRACARRGLHPVVTYRTNQTGAETAVQETGCGETLYLDLLRSDIGLEGSLPQVEVVVHCAGIASTRRSLIESSDTEIAELLEVHALGPLRLTRALLMSGSPLRSAVFVLSTAVACGGGGPYALSKVAGLAVCKLLADEFRPRGIAVHAVAPGWTETEMAATAAARAGRTLADIRAGHLDGRLLQPDEVGEACVRLAVDLPPDSSAQLVWWDRRSSREPVWLALESTLSFTEARQ